MDRKTLHFRPEVHQAIARPSVDGLASSLPPIPEDGTPLKVLKIDSSPKSPSVTYSEIFKRTTESTGFVEVEHDEQGVQIKTAGMDVRDMAMVPTSKGWRISMYLSSQSAAGTPSGTPQSKKRNLEIRPDTPTQESPKSTVVERGSP